MESVLARNAGLLVVELERVPGCFELYGDVSYDVCAREGVRLAVTEGGDAGIASEVPAA